MVIIWILAIAVLAATIAFVLNLACKRRSDSASYGRARRLRTQQLGKIIGRSIHEVRSETCEGCHVAWVSGRGQKCCAVVDGQAGPEYDVIHKPIFSPDGKSIAYAAGKGGDWSMGALMKLEAGGGCKWCVRIDGQAGPEFDGIGKIVFSSDAKRVAYGVKKGDKQLVIVDGKSGPEYDGIGENDPIFSPDSRHVAYAARNGYKCFVVVDGKAIQKTYDWIGDITFSPDGERMAYGAEIHHVHGMVDRAPVTGKNKVIEHIISAQEDGKRRHAIITEDNRRLIILDGSPGPEFDWTGKPIFSPDGKRVAYGAQSGDKYLVVLDSQSSPEYDWYGNIKFSPDGERVAYMAKSGYKSFLVVDGQIYGEYDTLRNDDPLFSTNSERMAYAAQKGKRWFVVTDGKANPDHDEIGQIIFSFDSNHIAYSAKEEDNWRVVVDGQVGPAYDAIGRITFSVDGLQLAYAAEKQDKWLVVVDGQPMAQYTNIVSGPVFLRDGSVEFIAVQRRMLRRVNIAP